MVGLTTETVALVPRTSFSSGGFGVPNELRTHKR